MNAPNSKRLARASLIAVLIAAHIVAVGGCGSDPTTSETDVIATDDADATSDTTTIDTQAAAELCEHVWGRLVACGHTYTFPTFEAECATFDAAEAELLYSCSLRVCAKLYLCVRDELHIPEGPR